MPLNNKQISFLNTLDRSCIHGKNILVKKDKQHIEIFYEKYEKFYNNMANADLNKKGSAFVEYKNFVSKNNRNNKNNLIFSAQSKFESTILEEFLYHLFKEFVDENNIKVGGVKAYNNLYFAPSDFCSFKQENFIKINEKDQDFSIYKIVKLIDHNKKEYQISIPVVSIECKTYIDKTMLEGSITTAEKIKNGNPHCKFYIVTETYEVNYNVDPSTSRIDNIFVLKKGGRSERNNPYCNDVIASIYEEVKTHLEANWSAIEKNIKEKGSVFN